MTRPHLLHCHDRTACLMLAFRINDRHFDDLQRFAMARRLRQQRRKYGRAVVVDMTLSLALQAAANWMAA